jgi:hypothetical protein
MPWPPISHRENVIGSGKAERQRLLCLSCPPAPQECDRRGVDVHASGTVGLRGVLDDSVADHHSGAANGEAATGQVDVGPVQAAQLTSAHAGEGRQMQQGPMVRLVGELEEPSELARLPDEGFGSLSCARAWW